MKQLRLVAAVAAIVTSFLLQATLVAPITMPLPISLPAVLVATVALADGAGAGMAFGFAAGLLADLGSTHPAGILALTWTCVGLMCGLAGTNRSVREDAVTAAVSCTAASMVAALLLATTGAAGLGLWAGLRDAVPAGLGDAIIALLLVPLARATLATEALGATRAPVREIRRRAAARRG